MAAGGELRVNQRVTDLREIPEARAVLLDTGPRAAAAIAEPKLSKRLTARLRRYRYGPGAFKVDWALTEPIPWRDPACAQAATVHVGGTLAEMRVSEREAWEGRVAERPFVLVGQPSLFDDTRAPAGRHVAWAYCHVPNGATTDMTARIERQIERFAPGFRDTIAGRHTMAPAALEAHNANLVGGDVTGGANDLSQLLFRPVPGRHPYRLAPGLYLCSAATPPGAGVHGMCGWHAARCVLRDLGVTSERQTR